MGVLTDGDWRLAASTAGQFSLLRARQRLTDGHAILTFHRQFVSNVLRDGYVRFPTSLNVSLAPQLAIPAAAVFDRREATSGGARHTPFRPGVEQRKVACVQIAATRNVRKAAVNFCVGSRHMKALFTMLPC